ncbi:hypothetical protein V2G26_015829 [Clonostachys chloroleuca]
MQDPRFVTRDGTYMDDRSGPRTHSCSHKPLISSTHGPDLVTLEDNYHDAQELTSLHLNITKRDRTLPTCVEPVRFAPSSQLPLRRSVSR